ncbi:MAG: hypothetical protein HKP27_06900 [Myxococcales bacterium]|nr:hypothetical protein [Myxococcales bacterium]
MALGKAIGDYDLKMTSVDHAEDGSSITCNFEGPATGFGTVLGTMIFRGGAPDKAGVCSWRSQAFLDNGDQNQGTGEGTWDEVGKHQWRVRLLLRTSDGQIIASDGKLDLASRTLKGKILEWS